MKDCRGWGLGELKRQEGANKLCGGDVRAVSVEIGIWGGTEPCDESVLEIVHGGG